MRKRLLYSILTVVVLIGITSCKRDEKRIETQKMLVEWIGKEIILPTDTECTYWGRDTVCPDTHTPYKILLYTDSTGCTSCKLQLYKWNTFIKEVMDSLPDRVSFHFYFQLKDEEELKFLLKSNHFKQAVYIDRESKLYATNKLPDNTNYQCFLLDKDNKVLSTGNPTLNSRIWDLYKQIITGEENMKRESTVHTTVEVEDAEIELKDVTLQETAVATFILTNTGNAPLLIKDISTSCGCTVPEWDKKPVKPGDRTEIKVKVTPDVPGHFRKTVTVFCNTQRGSISLAVKSMVK